MAERWLYGVEGGREDLLALGEPDPWTGGVPSSRDLGMLTEIVVIDGQVVDSRRRPVSGSGYECAALELDQRGPVAPRVERVVVREEPWEAMLHWLGRVVGGPDELDRLDAQPLPSDEELDLSGLSGTLVELVTVVDELVSSAGPPPVLGGELRTAYRRLLVRAAHSGMLRVWREVAPERLAATIIHCVVKANALTGSGAPFRVRDFISGLGVQQAPYDRSRSLALSLAGSGWPHGRRPSGAPDVFVLGDAGLLVSRFRHDLLTYRDLARRAEATAPDAADGGP